MNITGFVDLRAFESAFTALPKSVRKEVRREMKFAADIIVDKAKELAPVDTGHLKNMIRSRQADWASNGMVYEIVSTTIYNNSSYGPYPSFQEFGTRHNKAHPYLFPAVKASKVRVMEIIRNAISAGMSPYSGL